MLFLSLSCGAVAAPLPAGRRSVAARRPPARAAAEPSASARASSISTSRRTGRSRLSSARGPAEHVVYRRRSRAVRRAARRSPRPTAIRSGFAGAASSTNERLICRGRGMTVVAAAGHCSFSRLVAIDADGANLKLLGQRTRPISTRGSASSTARSSTGCREASGAVLMAPRICARGGRIGTRHRRAPRTALAVDRIDIAHPAIHAGSSRPTPKPATISATAAAMSGSWRCRRRGGDTGQLQAHDQLFLSHRRQPRLESARQLQHRHARGHPPARRRSRR